MKIECAAVSTSPSATSTSATTSACISWRVRRTRKVSTASHDSSRFARNIPSADRDRERAATPYRISRSSCGASPLTQTATTSATIAA